MKASVVATIAAAAAVSAQKYSTSIYTDCTPLADATLTSTRSETVTYCSECEGMPTNVPGGHYLHTTVMTITIPEFCPTGIKENTITITESCTGATPTWVPGNTNYVPVGYTTELMTCTVCGESPVTHVMTYPTGAPPTYPVPVPAQTPPPIPGSGSGSPAPGGYAPVPGPAGSCPGPECRSPAPGAPAPAPTPVSPAPAGATAPAGSAPAPGGCEGPDCSVPGASPGGVMPAPAGNSSGVAPFSGATSSLVTSISAVWGLATALIAGLLVMLGE